MPYICLYNGKLVDGENFAGRMEENPYYHAPIEKAMHVYFPVLNFD